MAPRGSADVIDDEDLLERCVLHGDRAAFATLAGRHRERVLGVCQLVVGGHTAVQAAATAALRDVWRLLEGGGPVPSSARALFVRGAVRRALAAADQAGAGEADATATGAALRRLAPRDRAVLALCDVAGLTAEEAAAALGEPPRQVRARAVRARRELAALLAASPPAPGHSQPSQDPSPSPAPASSPSSSP
ncbi:sigma factor-like helix-turn-helix DNA-binding protein [Streptomyces sp. B1866]|uniref:sigma factor-like helix-turn-helix DNA-binding protein n=1 Tax=Streptomyces sp. B1866 TaxID=3075431 RepID=UPI00288F6480|nr:sigma factor-like helix-turn-helix DNA-binding protein [Streptomyces sp. B1866]MDT3396030.1 sigma factor-like helix-turn-helix DNA-binding protein [Streptomyces sp. B1866]